MTTKSREEAQVHVLAVDDCPVTCELVRASLELFGYAVHVVYSGSAALEAAERRVFDAFVLDVDMPGLGGAAVGRALRSHPNSASALIAMHSGADEAAVRAAFSGCDTFLPKPCRSSAPGRAYRRDDPPASGLTP